MTLSTVTLKWNVADLVQAGMPATLVITPTAELSDTVDHEVISAVIACEVEFEDGTGQLPGIVANDSANIQPAGAGYLIKVIAATGQVIIPQFQTQILSAQAVAGVLWLDQLVTVPVVATGFAAMPLPSGTPGNRSVPMATGSGQSSAWQAFPLITVSPSAPSSPQLNDIWIEVL